MNRLQLFLINRIPRLGAALYAFKHGSDGDYIRKAVQTDPAVFQFHELGNENKDKNIYFVKMGDSGDGFFAEYNRLLMYLYTADKFHFTPVVYFTEKFLYREDHPVNGSDNPFEYYFLQPAGVKVSEIEKSRNVVFSEYVHTLQKELVELKNGLYGYDDSYIEMIGRINEKYIRMNSVVSGFVDQGFERICKGTDPERIIGVHFRGTDFKKGLDAHPVFMGPERQIKKVRELMEDKGYDRVFLATDDLEALNEFRDCFGDKLSFYDDVFRSDKDTSVAFLNDSRENHHYRLGLEVLRDMETLSRCGALVAGLSQVSLAARIRKSGTGREYRDLCLIDPGVVKNGKNPDKYYKSARKSRDSGTE